MLTKIYDYWRSSSAYRVRIALNIKRVPFEAVPVNIHPDVMAHQREAYRMLNPQMRVPAIELSNEVIGQSMAILEWIEETWPNPALLPLDPIQRLRVRSFADTIACDIQPLNNMSVLSVLKNTFGADSDAISHWYADWIKRGFAALEMRVQEGDGKFFFGEEPTLAEICLVPQFYNARRFGIDVSAFPRLVEVDAACTQLEEFQRAAPEVVKAALP